MVSKWWLRSRVSQCAVGSSLHPDRGSCDEVTSELRQGLTGKGGTRDRGSHRERGLGAPDPCVGLDDDRWWG